jgi:hypothetical protein
MNSSFPKRSTAAALAIVTIGVAGTTGATPQSFNYHGNAILVGGVTEEEREAMRQNTAPYNLWLAFVEQDTGNLVTGVKVSVVDRNENPVVDAVADGPWLLAQVPPGQYVVRMGNGQEQPVTVSAASRAMTILRLPRQP